MSHEITKVRVKMGHYDLVLVNFNAIHGLTPKYTYIVSYFAKCRTFSIICEV